MKSRLSSYFPLCARLLLGVIFILAAIEKIAHPAEFAKITLNYHFLPGFMVNIVAIVLPWLEALLGVAILCGWMLPGATLLANLLLLVFFIALAQAAARGINVHCGCFSLKSGGPSNMAWYLVRDSLFLMLGAFVAIMVFRRSSGGERKLKV